MYSIPAHPVLSTKCFLGHALEDGVRIEPVFDGHPCLKVTSGRAALALSLQLINAGRGKKVLVPAYNCRAMVAPIEALGASASFYKVKSDLSPDLDDIELKLTSDVRGLIVTHYFGFPNDVTGIAKLAKEHSFAVIEDCAHALFGSFQGRRLGSLGDYAICSPWKFLPIVEGGYLFANGEPPMPIALKSGGVKFEIKMLLDQLERAADAGRFGIWSSTVRLPFRLKNHLVRRVRRGGVQSAGAAPSSIYGSTDFDESWMYVRMSRFSKWLSDHVSLSRVVQVRRDNYRAMVEALEESETCRALFPHLPKNVVPYVCPILCVSGETTYSSLRASGIPAFRWEDIPSGVCSVSSKYKLNLIQLPIHQELSATDIQVIHNAVSRPPEGHCDVTATDSLERADAS